MAFPTVIGTSGTVSASSVNIQAPAGKVWIISLHITPISGTSWAYGGGSFANLTSGVVTGMKVTITNTKTLTISATGGGDSFSYVYSGVEIDA